jgi:hypothetical protein
MSVESRSKSRSIPSLPLLSTTFRIDPLIGVVNIGPACRIARSLGPGRLQSWKIRRQETIWLTWQSAGCYHRQDVKMKVTDKRRVTHEA